MRKSRLLLSNLGLKQGDFVFYGAIIDRRGAGKWWGTTRVPTGPQHLATLHLRHSNPPAGSSRSRWALFLFRCQIAARSAVPVDCVA
jgi:hypothetical protein